MDCFLDELKSARWLQEAWYSEARLCIVSPRSLQQCQDAGSGWEFTSSLVCLEGGPTRKQGIPYRRLGLSIVLAEQLASWTAVSTWDLHAGQAQ